MAAFRWSMAGYRVGVDASLRPDRHRGAADHGARDDEIHDRDNTVSAADRRLGQSSAMGFANEGDVANAYASVPLRGTNGETFSLNTKAAPRAPTFESRWRAWGAGFGGGQTTDGNAVTGSAPPPAAFTAWRRAPTTGCHRRRSSASHWQAAAPVSVLPLAAADEPTCSRPAHSSSTGRLRRCQRGRSLRLA